MNQIQINFYASFRSFAGAKSIQVDLPEGSSVKELLSRLETLYPPLRRQLLTPEGEVVAHIHLFINQRDISYLAESFNAPFQHGDILDLFPAVGGGSSEG
jgi:MoaD family protein